MNEKDQAGRTAINNALAAIPVIGALPAAQSIFDYYRTRDIGRGAIAKQKAQNLFDLLVGELPEYTDPSTGTMYPAGPAFKNDAVNDYMDFIGKNPSSLLPEIQAAYGMSQPRGAFPSLPRSNDFRMSPQTAKILRMLDDLADIETTGLPQDLAKQMSTAAADIRGRNIGAPLFGKQRGAYLRGLKESNMGVVQDVMDQLSNISLESLAYDIPANTVPDNAPFAEYRAMLEDRTPRRLPIPTARIQTDDPSKMTVAQQERLMGENAIRELEKLPANQRPGWFRKFSGVLGGMPAFSNVGKIAVKPTLRSKGLTAGGVVAGVGGTLLYNKVARNKAAAEASALAKKRSGTAEQVMAGAANPPASKGVGTPFDRLSGADLVKIDPNLDPSYASLLLEHIKKRIDAGSNVDSVLNVNAKEAGWVPYIRAFKSTSAYKGLQ